MIELEPGHRQVIESILRRIVPGIEVRAFGSRVSGNARRYSDLDLVLVGEQAVPGTVIEELKDAFSSSDLPMMVDVLDWHTLDDPFRTVLEQSAFHLVQASS